jgi:hypothetical protein
MLHRQILTLIATIGCLAPIYLSGCTATAPQFDAVYTRVSEAQRQPGQPLPAPKSQTIITVTGNIQAQQEKSASRPATSTGIQLDRENLASAGLVEYTINDIFEKKSNRFRGVLMRDLLALWQVSPEAKQVTLTALNDYKITMPIALLQQYPVILAMEQNGRPMQPDYRGPAMIVTPYEQYGAVPELANRDYWIWQVTKIHIE